MSHLVPCPHCGGEIADTATFCRHCGSSEADGWAEEDWDGGDEEFDYDEFVENEFGSSPVSRRLPPVWRITAFGLLLLIAIYFLAMI